MYTKFSNITTGSSNWCFAWNNLLKFQHVIPFDWIHLLIKL